VLIRRRLEREEKERLEVARLEKLEAMKRQLEEDRARIKEAGGVVFKGTWRGVCFAPYPPTPDPSRWGVRISLRLRLCPVEIFS
jgi:hypothetical protein